MAVHAETTVLSDIHLPKTSSGESMLETTDGDILDKIAWQWRAHLLTRNRFGKVSYPYSREVGLDFNAGSSKKQKLDLSSLTNSVMLDISDFSNDVGKSQILFICSILENNFNLGLGTDQLYEKACTFMPRIRRMMKIPNDTPEFLGAQFELPHMNTLSQNYSFPETSKPQHAKTKPASSTKMDGTLCSDETVPSPAEGQSLTETMRDLYPLCWEIGLDLRLNCWAGQKLDPSLLTKGVMIEVADFTKYLVGVPRQIMFDLLKHNFDLDIENLELSDIFRVNLCDAKCKRRGLNRSMLVKFLQKPFSLAPRIKKRKTPEGMEETKLTASECPRIKKVTESRRLDLKKKQEEQAKLKALFHYQARQKQCRQDVRRCTAADSDVLLRANTPMSGQERELSFFRPLEESDLEGWVDEPATCSESSQETNMNTETSKTFEESENYEDELPFHIEPSSCISLVGIQRDFSLLPVDIVACDREIKSEPTNIEGATQVPDIKVENVSSSPTTNEMEPLWDLDRNGNTAMVHMQSCDVTKRLEEDQRNSSDIWRNTACTQTTILSDIHFPGTPAGDTMLEKTNSDNLDQTAWQWRAHLLNRNRFGKVTYTYSREVGLDFNAGSSKKQRLDMSSLTNGVILDISDFSKDLSKAQMHFICSILENNFNLGLENDQRFQFACRVMRRVNDLMKRKMYTSECLGALFDLPDLNMRSALSGYIKPETSRPLHVKTEPASPTRIDGTSWSDETVTSPAEGQSQTEPSTTETMRDLYPLCWEIGLDLGLKSKCLGEQKLDLSLLTNGVMIEVANFTKYVCGVPKQIMFDLLKHNFDLDIEKLELSYTLTVRVNTAIARRKAYLGCFWKKALFVELQKEPLSLLPVKKRDLKVNNAPASKSPRLKKVTETRRRDLKKKQEEQDKLRMLNCVDKLPIPNGPWSCISLDHSYAKLNHQITTQISDSLPTETVACDREIKSEVINRDDASQALDIKIENVSSPASEIEPIWYINQVGKSDVVYLQKCDVRVKLEEHNANSADICTQTTRTSFREIMLQSETDINMKLEEDLMTSADIWRDTACAQTTLSSDRSLPRTLSGEMMLENRNDDILVKTAWQWRAHLLTRCGATRNTFPHSREVGLDFNAGSSKKQVLDLSSLTNGVMLDISDFSKDVSKAQIYLTLSILENNFHFGLENDQQRYDFAARVIGKVKDLRKKKYSPEFLGALFEAPDLRIDKRRSTWSWNDGFPKTFRPQDIKAEPASPTEMDRTLYSSETVSRPAQSQTLTEPSTSETMRELFPLCSEIGLDLGLNSKCWVGQKLDQSLLTNGVMIEVANFIKYVCGVPKQIMFDLLKHNFDLDIKNLDPSEIILRLCQVKSKKKSALYSGSPWKKALFTEFQKEPFSLLPSNKQKTSKDLKEANAAASEKSMRLSLKRKQKDQAKLKTKALYNCRGRLVIPHNVERCTTSDGDVLLRANSATFDQKQEPSFVCPLEESDLEDCVNEPPTCSVNYKEINMITAACKNFVECENHEDRLPH